MKSHILVLNYNGKHLLQDCLPSVVAAARAGTRCAVSVVDNGSQDGSPAWLARHWPDVGLLQRCNQGLVSFNRVLGELDERVVFLLNNDIKLDAGFVLPMLAPFRRSDCFMTAPLCWRFDGCTYEGMLTRVRMRRGLIEASTRFPGYERFVHRQGWTASAGPVLAVDREKFLALGGYDPLYLPGRIEDLDLCYRAWMAGWTSSYVPQAVAYHKGFGSFGDAYGSDGCDLLALRNTLLFIWKNLRSKRHLAAHAAALPIRFLHSCAIAPWVPARRRLLFCRALFSAIRRLPNALRARRTLLHMQQRGSAPPAFGQEQRVRLRDAERAYFDRFAWDAAGGLQ